MSDSTDDQTRGGTGTMALGFVIIIGGLVAIFFIGRAVYNKWISPLPSTVSLSAYFVDDAGKPISDPASPGYATAHIRIQGDIVGSSAGTARVMVQAPSLQFQESVTAPLVNGHFQIEDPAFGAIHPGTPTSLTAYVTRGSDTDTASIQLNSKSPKTKEWVYIFITLILLAFCSVFFYAFTGSQNTRKNQVAIIFSYLVIAIFLGVPILAPVVLIRTFPETVDDMIGVPAGLVVTCTSSQDARQHQWALNIGGYSFIPQAAPTPAPAARLTTAAAATDDSANPAPVTANPAPSTPAPPTGTAPGDCRDLSSATTIATTTPQSTVASSSLNAPLSPPIVVVEGGLVIPLYVIVLSVLGGAINMTRKVPSFQREDEAASATSLNRVSSLLSSAETVGTAFVNRILATTNPSAASTATGDSPPQPSPAQQAKMLDDEIGPLVADQVRRNDDSNTAIALIQGLVDKVKELYAAADDQQPLPYSSYDEWFASHPRLREVLRGNWRVALLNQYMYLISAPFLAIVTYYLLDLLGLSKPGVVVVLSFSVGLISEKIVTWILGVASGYLQTPKGT
jgi:hypothetical protein